MCGRYSVQKKTLLVANSLVKKNINVDLEQDNFNCAPGGRYPCIKSATNGKYLEMTVFGYLPSWSKPDFRRLHNARLEGIETKVSFKKLIVNSRAVVPLSGFIEWSSRENEKKVPYYFTRADSEDIFCPAIHDAGQFTIITREATEQNAKIHHRQPVIISKSQINNYFNLNNNAVEFLKTVKPPELKYHEISTKINNPSANDATLINPIN